MKNIKIIMSLLVLVSITSCDEFLSETPDNRTQIDTPEKISELLVTAYPNATYMDIAETMSDNVFDSEISKISLKNEQNYNWEMQTETNVDTQARFWNESYKAIASANQALVAIKQLGDTPDLNPKKGEALLARAYSHFMLVTLWSNRYNPSTAKSDLGIPYIIEPETALIKQYARNSVAEVFDMIQKDLEEGLKYVTNDYKEPKFHFNKEAAKAFACRFYLVKGDWNKVIELSKDLGVTPFGKLRDYSTFNAFAFAQMPIEYSKEDKTTNLLVSYPYSIWRRAYSNRFYLTGNKQDLILGKETNIFGKPWLTSTSGIYLGGINVFVNKFYEYFKYTNVTAQIGEPYTGTVLFSNDELFLNRIEAHVMTNQIDLANSELEYFFSTRTSGYNATTDKLTQTSVMEMYPVINNEYTPFYALTPIQASYIKAIAEARRRDFIHEGIRWFDIKRFNLVVQHDTYTAGKVSKKNILIKDDKRRALQIPLSASNNGIEKNPR
ncbi:MULTISPECIES: RagB/SusD family nutrient uptake outer membrane protein [unclassified Flavobacterium]|uniref:RagB/SusD family nutrient uptake outer membrane protein n=1 Tax=unclassified Flavobacterium TaxID=196869 RepID=UPI001A938FBB|nr:MULTISPECIES: RagB/SusD family nutrient uptake outer membrane protein [unclassified Flavobacterium]MCD0476377.1 RagB/SusD family nutrient uptake outer membrane protein [Flavobacterium sp. EDS]